MSDNTYKLKHPIELRDAQTGAVTETIVELALMRPKAKHLRAMDKVSGEMAQSLALIGAIANQPPSVVDLLDAEDVADLGEIVADFFGGRRRTGKRSTAT